MAGHSQFANIMHRKGAQDKKRAKLFTKLIREIIVAAKSGLPDPNGNPRLRAAITAARAANVPKDKIEGAIKKASSPVGGENYEELRYEAYAPGGVAMIIEILTDNRNRTASDVRSLLTKSGGNLGESGSVAFMFDKVGIIQYPSVKATSDQMLEAAIDIGADNCDSGQEIHEITCSPDNFATVRDGLNSKFGEPEISKIGWKPKNTIPVNQENAEKIIGLIESLEELDDVQNIYANYEIPDDVAAKLQSLK